MKFLLLLLFTLPLGAVSLIDTTQYTKYEIYTANYDILYVDAGPYSSTITSESTALKVQVQDQYEVLNILQVLSEPCDRGTYFHRIDSLNRVY